mmetsp:Transcript_3168/g.10409  ORF Transcript_3168/g.10409 Transcript_3168/m.10409 type:complete len:347 (-) Transcript_3168:703-1743(-)
MVRWLAVLVPLVMVSQTVENSSTDSLVLARPKPSTKPPFVAVSMASMNASKASGTPPSGLSDRSMCRSVTLDTLDDPATRMRVALSAEMPQWLSARLLSARPAAMTAPRESTSMDLAEPDRSRLVSVVANLDSCRRAVSFPQWRPVERTERLVRVGADLRRTSLSSVPACDRSHRSRASVTRRDVPPSCAASAFSRASEPRVPTRPLRSDRVRSDVCGADRPSARSTAPESPMDEPSSTRSVTTCSALPRSTLPRFLKDSAVAPTFVTSTRDNVALRMSAMATAETAVSRGSSRTTTLVKYLLCLSAATSGLRRKVPPQRDKSSTVSFRSSSSCRYAMSASSGSNS